MAGHLHMVSHRALYIVQLGSTRSSAGRFSCLWTSADLVQDGSDVSFSSSDFGFAKLVSILAFFASVETRVSVGLIPEIPDPNRSHTSSALGAGMAGPPKSKHVL
ncbi:unnamed protein product [Durusdinium trenchii]|uniref:Uncharacterized protein n=1 Tax=Durusdinium trenchii TaxID=1381693 RepID=A0ABP0SSU3_9DINO